MVDLHCHILPGVDDGAPSLEVSVEMLKVAAAAGTTDLAATPHANSEFAFDAGRSAALLAQLRELAPAGLTLHSGCDFHLAYENIRAALHDPTPFTVNGGKWLLVEFSGVIVASNTETILGEGQTIRTFFDFA